MARRRRMFKFSRAPARRRRRSPGRFRRSIGRFHARARGFGSRLTSGLPRWAKPSRIIAYTGIGAGVIYLLFNPIPNGQGGYDSWLGRIRSGYSVFQASKNPFDILGWDDVNNNAMSIAAIQLQQNAVGAVGTVIGFGIGSAIAAWFGM